MRSCFVKRASPVFSFCFCWPSAGADACRTMRASMKSGTRILSAAAILPADRISGERLRNLKRRSKPTRVPRQRTLNWAGWYDTKLNDYAAAIYHYQRFVQLQPNSPRTQSIDVQERIRGCKRELAGAEFPLPNNQNLQREVDKLTAENLALHQQLDAFRGQPIPASAPAVQASAGKTVDAPVVAPKPMIVAIRSPAPTRSHSYTVKQRDTISSIAAQHGVRSSAVLAVNPRLDPRKLRVGQVLSLP